MCHAFAFQLHVPFVCWLCCLIRLAMSQLDYDGQSFDSQLYELEKSELQMMQEKGLIFWKNICLGEEYQELELPNPHLDRIWNEQIVQLLFDKITKGYKVALDLVHALVTRKNVENATLSLLRHCGLIDVLINALQDEDVEVQMCAIECLVNVTYSFEMDCSYILSKVGFPGIIDVLMNFCDYERDGVLLWEELESGCMLLGNLLNNAQNEGSNDESQWVSKRSCVLFCENIIDMIVECMDEALCNDFPEIPQMIQLLSTISWCNHCIVNKVSPGVDIIKQATFYKACTNIIQCTKWSFPAPLNIYKAVLKHCVVNANDNLIKQIVKNILSQFTSVVNMSKITCYLIGINNLVHSYATKFGEATIYSNILPDNFIAIICGISPPLLNADEQKYYKYVSIVVKKLLLHGFEIDELYLQWVKQVFERNTTGSECNTIIKVLYLGIVLNSKTINGCTMQKAGLFNVIAQYECNPPCDSVQKFIDVILNSLLFG